MVNIIRLLTALNPIYMFQKSLIYNTMLLQKIKNLNLKVVMSREKNKYLNVFNIFFSGVKLYFQNLDKFMLYLAFPVFGQVLGVAMLLFTTYLYASNISNLMTTFTFLDNVLASFTLLIIFAVPAFFVLCKAFYDYLIAMAALNSVSNSLSAKGKNKNIDMKVHHELIKRRSFRYMWLLAIMGIIYIVGMLPFFWVILVLFLVYSCLAIQVFALEESAGPISAIKRSFVLIKNNFWSTTLLLTLLLALTYCILPNLITWAFEECQAVYYLSIPLEKYFSLLPIDSINQYIKSFNLNYQLEVYELARMSVTSTISFIVVSFTLPIRSCCCTLLYKQLDDEKIEENRKITKLDGRHELKKIIKKPVKKES